MRLLNKHTLELEVFLEQQTPPYVILSHRWSGTETTMAQFAAQKTFAPEQQSPGTAKALRLCAEAQSMPEDYVWIDTCCIDKSSSAELQEAINSMYGWYQRAELCIVYISDVDIGEDDSTAEVIDDQLHKSKWFTRGWTLQELLAPRRQIFVDRNWHHLGNREQLSSTIESITGIRAIYYGDADQIHAATVAERMSWLSLRETSRVEDMAYCMLGIFDVNITMLYGEGHKAFLRLQKEIIHTIDDESIFLWQPVESSRTSEDLFVPVLAPLPVCFSVCRGHTIVKDTFMHRDPYRWTTKGLEFELYGSRILQHSGSDLRVLLNCKLDDQRACFDVRRSNREIDFGGNIWMRLATPELKLVDDNDYERPPSLEDAYRRAVQDLTLASLNTPIHQHRSQGMMPVINYERESVRFKIFIE